MKEIYETIRFDHSIEEEQIQIQAVKVSEESLGRMVKDFNHEIKKLSPSQLDEIEKAARLGDLSTIMEAYEEEVKSPVKSALFGNFVRLVLIQVQKQKGSFLIFCFVLFILIFFFLVDVEKSFLWIQKLMKGNELNFQFFAMVPAAIIIWLFVEFWRRDKTPRKTHKKLQIVAREVHVLLNQGGTSSKLTDYEYGKLLISLQSFLDLSKKLGERLWLEEDVLQLQREDCTIQQRLNTLNRMYATHKFLQTS